MPFIRTPARLALLAGAAISVASAQPGPSAQPAYRSAFEGYRGHQDEPLTPWRQANETVGRIGGWQAYAREAQAAASAPPASGSAPGSHSGHHPKPKSP
jgi:hypothetical protein